MTSFLIDGVVRDYLWQGVIVWDGILYVMITSWRFIKTVDNYKISHTMSVSIFLSAVTPFHRRPIV